MRSQHEAIQMYENNVPIATTLLAHFSTSRAAAVSATVSVPVLSAPEAAVTRMRSLVEAGATSE